MMRNAFVATLIVSASLAAAAAPPRLEPGNWRVRVTNVTNGVADAAQDFEICLRDELKDWPPISRRRWKA